MRWYKWLCLAILITITGIPVALFKAIVYLAEGLPRYAVVVLANVPVNWGRWLLGTVPMRIAENPPIGIAMLLGTLAIPAVCLWLLFRKGKGKQEAIGSK